MANLNKVFLIGNLTRDPELRYTPSGTAVAEFGMAMNRRWTGRDGQKNEDTCFVDVQAWARQGEVISEYCRKGRAIFVEGRLQLNTWEGRDGQKRNKLRVVVENFQFLGGGGGGSREEGQRQQGQGPAPRSNVPPPGPPSSPPPGPPSSPPSSDASPPRDEPEGQFQVDDDIPF